MEIKKKTKNNKEGREKNNRERNKEPVIEPPTSININEGRGMLQDATEMIKRIFYIRNAKGQLSKAHAFDHVEAVARNAYEYVIEKGGDEETAERAYIAGIFHDVERKKNEKLPHAPLGAKWLLTSREGRKIAERYGENALNQIAFAIALHSLAFDKVLALKPNANRTDAKAVISLILEKGEINTTSEDIEKQCVFDAGAKLIAEAITYADKITEAKGPRVVERRSFFVGGERARNDKKLIACLEGIGRELGLNEEEKGDLFPLLAIIGESVIRWYIKNPLSKYPKEIQERIKPKFYWEQLFVSALVKAISSNEKVEAYCSKERIEKGEFIIRMMKNHGFPKFSGLNEEDREGFKKTMNLADELSKEEVDGMKKIALAYGNAAKEGKDMDCITFNDSLINALSGKAKELMLNIRKERR